MSDNLFDEENEGTLSFIEKGVKLEFSIADKVGSATESAAASVGVAALSAWTIVGAVAFVISIIAELAKDDTVQEALKLLQRQINEIKAVVTILDQRVDELVYTVAASTNKLKLALLSDYSDEIGNLQTRLRDQPRDIDTAVLVANEGGVVADKFLRSDYEVWRWVDVVMEWHGEGEHRRLEPVPVDDAFKNVPTLPIYLLALVNWLSARQKVISAGQQHRLVDDEARVRRHLAAVSVRDSFDKYSPDPNRSMPRSITENIKYRIRALVQHETRYSENNRCRYYHHVGNLMTGRSHFTDSFDVHVPENGVFCTVDPTIAIFGAPEDEFKWEEQVGVNVLEEMSRILERVAGGGSLIEPVYPPFSHIENTEQAILYMVLLNGDVIWWSNYQATSPGGSMDWGGPKKIKTGWGQYAKFFNAGGQSIYYIDSAGKLFGQAHKGLTTGADAWSESVQVGSGWNMFAHVFSGGEKVIYGMQPNGDVRWYRHTGGPIDPSAWEGYKDVTPPATLATMQQHRLVFSSGKGNIHSVDAEGRVSKITHSGYHDGSNDWLYGGSPGQIAAYWNRYAHVAAAPNNLFYCLTAEGELHWYRFLPDTGGWEGPVTMQRRIPACRAMFAAMLGVPTLVT